MGVDFQRSRAVYGFASIILALGLNSSAFAYTHTVTPSGQIVKHSGNPRLDLVGNSGNRSGISQSDLFSLVTRSLQRWQTASGGSFNFEYWQGTDTGTYAANSDYNGLSSVYFTSQSGETLPSNIVGLTQVWYDTNSGQILESDTALNDVRFHFSTDPRDTSGYGGSTSPTGSIYIGNILTHELGHALGLAHSGNLQASMIYVEGPEQAVPSCDDQRILRATYGTPETTVGDLTVAIKKADGSGVFGAQVSAISIAHGRVEASVLSSVNGDTFFGAMPEGEYLILVEPFYSGANTLPGFYSGINAQVCSGGNTFVRTFSAQTVSVRAGQRAVASAITVQCGSSSTARAAAVPQLTGGSGLGDAVVMAQTDEGSFLSIDRSSAANRYYKLPQFSGPLRVQALGYSLFSPIKTQLAVYHSDGSAVTGSSAAPVDALSSSTYRNYDSAWISTASLPVDDYVIEVTPSMMSSAQFPEGTTALDTTPFFLLIADGSSKSISEIAQGARCRLAEPTTAYQSPAGGPVKKSTQRAATSTGGCGRVQETSDREPPEPPSASVIAGWFLPFFLMGVGALGLRFRSRTLTLKG